VIAAALLVAVGVVYSWWATGLRPFTATAYVAVGIPVLVVALGAVIAARRASGPPGNGRWRTTNRVQAAPTGPVWRQAAPWIVIGCAGLGLEIAGLALGGRSARLPTLSTVADHALRWHGTRWVLFVAWLACGAALVGRGALVSGLSRRARR
jgi:hypothetical protein